MTVFLPQEVIRKKRDGHVLSPGEMGSFFSGFLRGEVADYQVSALLMAIFQRGMSVEECAQLTKLMRDSGQTLKWAGDQTSIADKHSTGGVGDKTSLILLPLCILEGLRVPMISGRGLGHTGGTLDKLEAIPGMKVQIDTETARRVFEKHGGVFMGQTENLCPLDKSLYALRDVTATIESIPLITASILSKKLAEGIGTLCMDVKTGSGAFMSKLEDARRLSRSLVEVGSSCGLRVSCLITDMDSPLGRSAGHLLEIAECAEVLQNKGPTSTRELSLALAGRMVELVFPDRKSGDIRKSLEAHLQSGAAWQKFLDICQEQGSESGWEKRLDGLGRTQMVEPLLAAQDGWVADVDTRSLGIAIQLLGGGRRLMTDPIDPAVGLGGLKHKGERVSKGEPFAVVYANDRTRFTQALELVKCSYRLSATVVPTSELVLEIIN